MEQFFLLLLAILLAYGMFGSRPRTHTGYIQVVTPDEDRPGDGCLPVITLLLIGLLVLSFMSLHSVPSML